MKPFPKTQALSRPERQDPAKLKGVYLVKITPQLAEAWLALNLGQQESDALRNRPESGNELYRLAEAIKRGEWEINGETIKFNEQGRLFDGQTRLGACFLADKEIVAYVAFGLDGKSFHTVDIGRRRTPGHMLASAGETSSVRLAAAAHILMRYEDGSINSFRSGRSQPTVQQIERVLENHPTLRECISDTQGGQMKHLVPHAPLAAMLYIFRSLDRGLADQFVFKLNDGSGLESSDPVHVLRERLIRAKSDKRGKLSSLEVMAITIHMWNAARAKRKMPKGYRLRWMSTQDFPVAE